MTKTHLGLGVAAAQRFRKDDVVSEVRGEWFDDPDYESDYCIDMGGDKSLEPHPPFRYLNHSCDPSCELVVFDEEEALCLVALRDIEAGEPLTIDYEWPADSTIPCACGSANCRGWIVSKKERKKPKRAKP